MDNLNYNTVLEAALTTPIVEFNGVGFEQGFRHSQRCNALLFLVLDEKRNGVSEKVHTRIMQHLRSLIKGGHEPAVDVMQIWAYPTVASVLAICANTVSIWGELTDDEVSRMDTIMTAFAVMNNFATNDANDYFTGFNRRGDYDKRRPPNFRLPVTLPISAATVYFGSSEAVDKILCEFNFDDFKTKLKEFGFTNMLKAWDIPSYKYGEITVSGTKELIHEGGLAFIVSKTYMDAGNVYRGGTGKGATMPYVYKNTKADSYEFLKEVVGHTYSGGIVKSTAGDNNDGTHMCYIMDGSKSPVEGFDGMLAEYNAKDGEGLRSDAFYCQMAFNMIVAYLTMLKVTAKWDENFDTDLYKKVWVGNTDHIYKLSKGYQSHAMGMYRVDCENNLRGYLFTKCIWKDYFKQLDLETI